MLLDDDFKGVKKEIGPDLQQIEVTIPFDRSEFSRFVLRKNSSSASSVITFVTVFALIVLLICASALGRGNAFEHLNYSGLIIFAIIFAVLILVRFSGYGNKNTIARLEKTYPATYRITEKGLAVTISTGRSEAGWEHYTSATVHSEVAFLYTGRIVSHYFPARYFKAGEYRAFCMLLSRKVTLGLPSRSLTPRM